MKSTQEDRDDGVAALFAAHFQDLARTGYLMTGQWHVGEEHAQEAIAAVWRKWNSLRRAEAALPYARRCVINASLRYLRRREVDLTEFDLPADQIDVAGALDIAAALAALPHRKRACVVLRYFANLTAEEAAEVLGVSVGTVKSQTHKALVSMRSALTTDEARGDLQ